MKKADITFWEKVNELRLDISHPNSKGIVFVLLEGNSDIRLFRKFFNLNKCKVESIPGGNEKLEDCVSLLSQKYPLIIGVRDADFIRLSSLEYRKDNMFLTDYHDMEMSMINEDESFNSLVFEYTDITEKQGELRLKIITIIENISYLKWLNSNENLEFNFNFGYQDLIEFDKGQINFEEYFKRVLAKSPLAKIQDFAATLAKIAQLKESRPNMFQLCNGHDFIKVFAAYIRKYGNQNGIHPETLSSGFRMAYRIEHFKKTQWFLSSEKWAVENDCNIFM